MATNFFKDNEDLQFYFNKFVDWDRLVQLTEGFGTKEAKSEFSSTQEAVDLYREIAEMFGEFVAQEIKPYEKQIDAEGVHMVNGEVEFPARLKGIFDKIRDLEIIGLTVPRELGGQNAPMMLYFINSEMMARADVSAMAHLGFHTGMAMAALVFSAREGTSEADSGTGEITKTRWPDMVQEIIEGKAWGCMDITEPDAGSDMGALRAVGEQDQDGNWFVTGEKIFITSGHGKYHFVVAKTEPTDSNNPMAGLGALSMFLVPAYHEDEFGNRTRVVPLSRVEEKIGHHGSATCGLVYDRAPAELVGLRGEGFKYMLLLMNNARISVGFECLGLCESAYRAALDYAAERRSMGKSIDRHEMIADYLEQIDIEIKAIRAMSFEAAFNEECSQKLDLRLRFGNFTGSERVELETEMKEAQRKSRRLTPLLKYLAAEKSVEHSRLSLQIHGGNGYITEYLPEKLLRDSLVMPIYEGTSQIQALMAMKDTLGAIIKNPQAFVARIAQARWRAATSRDPLDRRLAALQVASLSAQQSLVMRTAGDKVKGLRGKPISDWSDEMTKNWDPKRDFAYAMLHAEKLIQILIDESIAVLFYKQAKKFPERVELLERWLERAEPRVRYNVDRINHTGERLLNKLAGGDAQAQAAE